MPPFKYSLLACLFSLGVLTHASAQPSPSIELDKASAFIAPFVDETTFLIVRIDPTKLELSTAQENGKDHPTAIQDIIALQAKQKQLKADLERVRKLAAGQTLYATVGIPASKVRTSMFVFRRAVDTDDLAQLTWRLPGTVDWLAYKYQDYLVLSSQADAVADSQATPEPTQQAIQAAFAAVEKAPIQIIVVPPEYVWRTVRELSPNLPRQLGGGPSEVLTEGIQWLAMGIDLQTLQADVVIQSSSADAAQQFAGQLPVMLRSLLQSTQSDRIPKSMVEPLLALIQPQVSGSQLKQTVDLSSNGDVNVYLLVERARTATERVLPRSLEIRFRRILLAVHNYHDTYRQFPPLESQLDDEGKPLLSWRVHLLPFLDELELYNKFHLNEPWDSPHNKSLLEQMPDIYAKDVSLSPPPIAPGHTTLQAPFGENTIFDGGKGTSFRQITDGSSNTIAIIEVTAANAVPWTAPQDYAFDPESPLVGIRFETDDRWLAGFADGSVHSLRRTLSPISVLHLFQRNDGQVVALDE